MSGWIDDQAEESDHENEERPTKKRRVIGSDDDDEEEEEDESKIAAEMEGFVVTGDDDEEEGEDEADKRSESEESVSELEEDDADLIAENLGEQKRRKPRHVILGSDEEEENEGKDENERQALEYQLFGGDEDAVQRRQPKGRQAHAAEEEGDRSESDDGSGMEDFIEDEMEEAGERRPRPKTKNKRLPVSDQALEEARDIFGVDFDYDDLYGQAEEGEEEEEEEEVEEAGAEGEERRVSKKVAKKKPQRRTLLEQIEPSELERGFLSELDKKIQTEDKPERFQLRSIPVTEADESELSAEAAWIHLNAFSMSPISLQDVDTKPEAAIIQIKEALNFIRNQDFEVPFIAFYRKEYVDKHLNITNLWKVYQWDEKWCQLQNRRKNLMHLFQRMQAFQFKVLMEESASSSISELRALTEEDCADVHSVQTQEQLQDMYSYFLLYYGREIPKMIAYEKFKEAQEQGEDSEPIPMQKQASRRDKYSICVSAGLGSFAKLFGLTPKLFAKNLEYNYLINEVEQHPEEPLIVAEGFLCSTFPTPEAVLRGAVYVMAMQLSREPAVRKIMRSKYRETANISVRPTKKGRKEIDENHPVYPRRYLKNKPAKEFKDEEFLHLLQAEENGLIKITVSVDLPDAEKQSLCQGIIEIPVFRKDEYTRNATEWNALRDEAVKMCFEEILYPIFEKELKTKLIQEAKDCVVKGCASKCAEHLKIAPYVVDVDENERERNPPTVLGIAYSKEQDQASFGAAVDLDGEVVSHVRLVNLTKRRNSFRQSEKHLKELDLETLKKFITTKNVRVIAVAADSMDALMILDDMKAVIAEMEAEGNITHQIDVEVVDNELAKVYMDTKRAQSDFPDYPLLLRQAISLARRLLDPLLEFAQLCNADDEIMCLKFHPLQETLSKEDVLTTVTFEFVNRVNEVGVDVNRCLEHSHTSSVLQFVCGLGPRKAAYLLRVLRQSGNMLENRTKLVTLCHMGPKVFMNCAGFIKIDTAKVAEKSEVYVEVLDGSRIHPETYEWARKMAVDALEYDDTTEDANPASALEEILEAPERLKDLDLDAFAEELERQGFGNKNITLYDIRAELNHRYKDLRTKYHSPAKDEVFYMLTKETSQTFDVGKLVLGRVVSIVYRKPQVEQLDQTNPVRNEQTGLWQCPHCLKNDFFELSAVWTHFDLKECPGQAIGVRVRLENGISGFIAIQNISDKGVKNPEERVAPGMPIYCRITKVDTNRFSVDLTCRTKDLLDHDKKFKPVNDRHYDYQTEESERNEEQQAKELQKKQQYLRRVIAHDAFHNCSFKEAERILANAEQGDVIIRPSSKGTDHLTVTWKVADGIYQHIDVKEERKQNSFSLGQSLYIGEDLFEDLDEIIARHVNPMAMNAREILNYKYYFESDSREDIENHLRQEKENSPSRIPYVLSASKEYPGKFMLSYLPQKSVRHEYVTAVVDGFRFRSRVFRTFNDLLKWFKEHYHEPPPTAATGIVPTPMGQMSFMGATPRFDIASRQNVTPHFDAASRHSATPRFDSSHTPYNQGHTPSVRWNQTPRTYWPKGQRPK